MTLDASGRELSDLDHGSYRKKQKSGACFATFLVICHAVHVSRVDRWHLGKLPTHRSVPFFVLKGRKHRLLGSRSRDARYRAQTYRSRRQSLQYSAKITTAAAGNRRHRFRLRAITAVARARQLGDPGKVEGAHKARYLYSVSQAIIQVTDQAQNAHVLLYVSSDSHCSATLSNLLKLVRSSHAGGMTWT